MDEFQQSVLAHANEEQMMATIRAPKGQTISIRISEEQRDVIDQAAEPLGKSRSDFMVETSFREAEQVLLDRTFFRLDEAQFAWFMEFLENPPPPNEKLRKLMATKAPWE